MENVKTLQSYLKKTIEYFQQKNIENFKYIAEKLLAETLTLDRLELFLQMQRPLTEEEVELYRRKIKQFLDSGSYQQKISIKTAEKALKSIFYKNSIPESDINAEYILAHVLGIKRLDLKFIDDREMTEEELKFLSIYKKRRLAREPLEYILGYTEFYGEKFFVNKNVLIPRSETEFVIENTLKYLKNDKLSILEIGTGSGVIPIILKKNLPDSKITSIDISQNALVLAQKNTHSLNTEINFIEADILNEHLWKNFKEFDLIISNPPYVSFEEYKALEPEVRDFEPEIALHDKGDGLLFYKKIIDFSQKKLRENSFLAFETGANQHSAIIKYAENSGLACLEAKKDYAGHERFLIFSKAK